MQFARKNSALGLAPILVLGSVLAVAEPLAFEIVIREHRFEPSVLEIPAGKRVKLLVHNLDSSPEEFESYELRREKIVGGHSTVTIYIGPLKAGEYPFFGEFNADTAQGRLIAR
jgi:Cupredoxin-like domain